MNTPKEQVLRLAALMREGRKLVKDQADGSFFRYPDSVSDTPVAACALGCAMLAAGVKPIRDSNLEVEDIHTYLGMDYGIIFEDNFVEECDLHVDNDNIYHTVVQLNDQSKLTVEEIAEKLECMAEGAIEYDNRNDRDDEEDDEGYDFEYD